MTKLSILKSKVKAAAGKAGSAVMKGANAVTNAVGARDLADYAGSKLAKATVPKEQRQYVSDTVSGKSALKSAGKLGLSLASVASVAGMARGLTALAAKGAAKNAGKATAKRILAKHKAGGDTKMLEALKKAGQKNTKTKIPVKDLNPKKLDSPIKKFQDLRGTDIDAVHSYNTTKRDILSNVLREKKLDAINKAYKKYPTKNEVGRWKFFENEVRTGKSAQH